MVNPSRKHSSLQIGAVSRWSREAHELSKIYREGGITVTPEVMDRIQARVEQLTALAEGFVAERRARGR